jgi:hypothetical protein
MKELLSLKEYLKNPYYTILNTRPSKYSFIFLYGLYIIGAIISIIIINIYNNIFNIEKELNQFIFFKNETLLILLYIGIIAPIIEEIQFRLLLKPSKNNIKIFYIVTLFMLSIFLYFKVKTGIIFNCILIIFTGITLLITKYNSCIYIQKHFYIFFYISVVSFGFLHIFSFKGELLYLIIGLPLLTAPQLLAGSILGYIRMNYGFIYGVLFHIIINLLISSFYL